MANEIEFSFLEPQDLMTKTTYDSNGDNVVELAQDIEGFAAATDNTFYGKVGGVTGFFTVPSGAQAINDLTDVDTTGISIGQVLQYDGTNFVPFTITDQVGATILDELGDVDTTTTAPTNGDTLVFNGTNFVPQAPSGGGASIISDLTDVDTTGVALNNVLKYDGTNWVDGSVAYSEVTGTPTLATVATTGAYTDLTGTPTLATVATTGAYTDLTGTPTIPASVNDLNDVDTTGITSGQVLQYNGTTFVAATVSGSGATILDELGDVDTTTTAPTSGDALVFDGTNFVPQAVSGSGATILNELTDVDTTGVVTDNVLKFNGTTWVDDVINYSEISGTPTLATVATTGNYNDLSNLPNVPTTVNSLTDVDTTGVALNNVLKYDGTNWVDGSVAYSEVTGTPTLATVATTGAYADLTGTPTIPANINDLGDVNTTGITSGQVLQYDGTTFVPFTITDQVGATILDELGDVDTTTTAPTNGDTLVFNGTNFVPQAPSGGASIISDLTDVDTTGVALNNVLKYDGTNWVDGSVAYSEVTGTPTLSTVATTGSYNDLTDLPVLATVATSGDYNDLVNKPVIPTSINELSDVDTTGITAGQVLEFNGTSFVAATVSGSGATVLDELGDVDTTTTAPTNGDALVYNGTNFVPQAISGGSSTFSYEWVELWYTSGSSGNLTAVDAIQNETAGVTTTIVDGAGGIVEFRFTGKSYPPLSIQQYAHVTTTNEYIINTPVTGTRKVSGGGATYDQTTLFTPPYENFITLDCAMGRVGASAGLGQRSRLYIMFAFGE